MLICRFAKFVQGIKKSPKLAVQFLYEKIKTNVNTVTGRNVAFVLKATGYKQIEDINTKEVKERVKFAGSEENTWRGDFIKEIVNVKNNVLVLNEDESEVLFDKEDFDDIIEYLCTS